MLDSHDDIQSVDQSDASAIVLIQLLLFVDDRPGSQEQTNKVTHYLEHLSEKRLYELEIIEIWKNPHLVEHFRLIATPALVKIFPEPRQTLAGSNIVSQLEKWWPRWLQSLEENKVKEKKSSNLGNNSASKEKKMRYSTELMRISDEVFCLKQEKEALLEQLKFKDQVLAMLAHDLRSPLTAASIAVETLEITENQEPSDRITQLKSQLHQQARKQFQLMNRLITDILQASQSMNAHLQVNHSKLLMQHLCEDVLLELKHQFKAKSLTIKQDLPQDLPPVYADEELMRQVLVNLLENAIKYTPETGTITLSILHRTTQKIQVSVCDTGPGIPEEKQERIFEGHFRLKRDEGKEGYGLGLSLCRKIVQAHYGQIWVDSVLEQGSCFHFTLPVYR